MADVARDHAFDILRAARSAEESDLGALSVSLARAVVGWARSIEDHKDQRQRRALTEILHSPESQQFSFALTDRVHRSANASETVAALKELVGRLGPGPWLPTLDRVQLRALTTFGPAMPDATISAVKARLAAEAHPFVLDATPYELSVRLDRIRRTGAQVNLNYLGEEVLGEEEAARTLRDYLRLLERPDIDALSIKLSNVYSQANLLAFDHAVEVLTERLAPVFEKARQHDKLLYFDMEAFRDLTLNYRVFERLVQREDLLGVKAGLAVQAYLPDALPVAQRLAELAERRVERGGQPLRMRLVKGANLAMEQVEASSHRWDCPVFSSKLEVDAHFKRLLRLFVVDTYEDFLSIGVGSHNVFDLCFALVLREQRGTPEMVQLEMLQGMAGSLGRVFEDLSGSLLLYAPCVLPENFSSAISYLVRRLDENTGPDNYLRNAFDVMPGDERFQAESKRFLLSLSESHQFVVPSFRRQSRAAVKIPKLGLDAPFDNEPDTDLTRAPNRKILIELIRDQKRVEDFGFGIAGCDPAASSAETRELVSGFDPSRPGHEAYRYELAGPTELGRALESAAAASSSWARVPAQERAALLDRIANGLAAERNALIAAMVTDAGKRALEADVEVSEAIDFCRYYARSFVEWSSRYELRPRGPFVVTPPWNFPLAIPVGGCVAALVAGNPVIFKPAPETPLVAYAAARIMWQAGVPRDVLGFAPCKDEHASQLITDPRVQGVVLTGATSTARLFMQMRPDLYLLAETGGKNGAYVAPLCDREQAIGHVVQSAFGHAGQKCSALSQLVLHDEVFFDEDFKRRLVDATTSLHVGSAHDPKNFVTPLIRPATGPLERILTERGAPWLVQPRVAEDNPQLVSPGILWDVKPGSFAHQTEFFGPVLSVLRAPDLQTGLRIINGTPYGLTAGFFGLRESEQEQFVANIDAGNVYINRSITGAIVGRQPFGGRKASHFGPGAKAGGPGYVLQFCHVGAPKSQATGGRAAMNLGDVLPPTRGTEVAGESNVMRYQPTPTVIVYFADASHEHVALARRAQEVSGGPPLVVDGSAPDVASAIAELSVDRVRVVGTAPPAFVESAARRGWVLLRDAIHQDPTIEVRRFCHEQSISVAYHRYGNRTLGSLNRLTSPSAPP